MKKEIKPSASIDKKGRKITKEIHEATMAKRNGKAYGLFICNSPRKEIELELPKIRKQYSINSNLELSLIEGKDNVDSRLAAITQEADQEEGNQYNYILDIAKDLFPLYIYFLID